MCHVVENTIMCIPVCSQSPLPAWSVVNPACHDPPPDPSLPCAQRSLVLVARVHVMTAAQIFPKIIFPMSLCLLPKLWHWLNKQVMTRRSRVLRERLTESVYVKKKQNSSLSVYINMSGWQCVRSWGHRLVCLDWHFPPSTVITLIILFSMSVPLLFSASCFYFDCSRLLQRGWAAWREDVLYMEQNWVGGRGSVSE